MTSKKPWVAAFGGADFEVAEDKLLADSFYQLRELQVSHKSFGGNTIEVRRDLFKRPDAVAVLLYDDKLDAVVMVEQFRIGALSNSAGPWLLELVAGIVEPGESIQEVARRECFEEAGVTLNSLEHIYKFSPSPGGSEEYIDLFCARVDASQAGGIHGLATEGEDIKVHVFDAQVAIDMLKTGEIINSFSIIALQWLALERLTNSD